MENYKNYLKLYSNILKEKSIILRLLDIGKCNSLIDVRNIISNCKWNDKNKKINTAGDTLLILGHLDLERKIIL